MVSYTFLPLTLTNRLHIWICCPVWVISLNFMDSYVKNLRFLNGHTLHFDSKITSFICKIFRRQNWYNWNNFVTCDGKKIVVLEIGTGSVLNACTMCLRINWVCNFYISRLFLIAGCVKVENFWTEYCQSKW